MELHTIIIFGVVVLYLISQKEDKSKPDKHEEYKSKPDKHEEYKSKEGDDSE